MLKVLFGLVALAISSNTLSFELYLVELEKPSVQTKRVMTKLTTLISQKMKAPLQTITLKKIKDLPSANNSILITLGSDSLTKVLTQYPNYHVLAALISKHSFTSIISQHHSTSVSAIYSEPSPYRQIALIKALYGASATAGIIKTPYAETYLTEYQKAAKQLNVPLVIQNLKQGNAANTLKYLSTRHSLILLKDKDLFRDISVEDILITAYDLNQQGVIGFNQTVTKSGGVATTYASIEHIASSIYDMLLNANQLKRLPEPTYSQFFDVATNQYVMRSLNIIEASDKQLKKTIEHYIEDQEQ